MNKKLLQNIDDVIFETVSSGDSTFLDSFIEAQGYSLSDISSISSKAQKKNIFVIKGIINRKKDQALLEKITLQFRDAILKNTEKPLSFLRNLIEEKRLTFQYRNLDKLNLEDIRKIIQDQNLLELLERFENEEEQ